MNTNKIVNIMTIGDFLEVASVYYDDNIYLCDEKDNGEQSYWKKTTVFFAEKNFADLKISGINPIIDKKSETFLLFCEITEEYKDKFNQLNNLC